jgi:uncharacterized protein YuzE
MASFEFDPEVSVLYLWLRNGKPASTETLRDDVIVDLDSRGRTVGLELFLPRKMPKEIKEQLAAAARRSLRRGTRANPPRYQMLR